MKKLSNQEILDLKPGDHVWLVNLKYSSSGRIIRKIFAELEKNDLKSSYMFKTIRVFKGTALRENEQYYYCHDDGFFFKKIDDGIEYWNYSINHQIEKIESQAETKIKSLKKNIIND